MQLNWKVGAGVGVTLLALALWGVTQFQSDAAPEPVADSEPPLEAKIHEPETVRSAAAQPILDVGSPETDASMDVPNDQASSEPSRRSGSGAAAMREGRRVERTLEFVEHFAQNERLTDHALDQLRNVLLTEAAAVQGASGDTVRIQAAHRAAEKRARSILTARQFQSFQRQRESQRRGGMKQFR